MQWLPSLGVVSPSWRENGRCSPVLGANRNLYNRGRGISACFRLPPACGCAGGMRGGSTATNILTKNFSETF